MSIIIVDPYFTPLVLNALRPFLDGFYLTIKSQKWSKNQVFDRLEYGVGILVLQLLRKQRKLIKNSHLPPDTYDLDTSFCHSPRRMFTVFVNDHHVRRNLSDYVAKYYDYISAYCIYTSDIKCNVMRG